MGEEIQGEPRLVWHLLNSGEASKNGLHLWNFTVVSRGEASGSPFFSHLLEERLGGSPSPQGGPRHGSCSSVNLLGHLSSGCISVLGPLQANRQRVVLVLCSLVLGRSVTPLRSLSFLFCDVKIKKELLLKATPSVLLPVFLPLAPKPYIHFSFPVSPGSRNRRFTPQHQQPCLHSDTHGFLWQKRVPGQPCLAFSVSQPRA